MVDFSHRNYVSWQKFTAEDSILNKKFLHKLRQISHNHYKILVYYNL